MQADRPEQTRAEILECPICLHDWPRKELTRHHLIPKSRKGRDTVLICQPCHKQIHAVFTEKELERNYHTIETLLEAEEFRSWVAWIRKRRPNRRIRVRKTRSRSRKH